MSRDQTGLRAVLREITESAERSSLFWWMVEHHQELSEASKDRRLPWRNLCARFAELGLADATGKPATPETARLTWRRARKAVADAERRATAAKPPRPGSVYPSRISPNWSPQEVQPAAGHRPAPPATAAPAAASAPQASLVPQPTQQSTARSPVPFAATRTKEEVDALMEQIGAELKEFDRKRFGSFEGG